MAFCSQCGAQIPDGSTVCQSCAAQQQAAGAQPTGGEKFEQAFQNFQNTVDNTSAFDPADIARNKGMSALAYIGILFLIPLFAAKESPYAQFHSNQGLVLFIAEAAVAIVFSILMAILGWPLHFLRVIVGVLQVLVNIFLLVLAILGIINAATGKAKELPIIGGIHLLK